MLLIFTVYGKVPFQTIRRVADKAVYYAIDNIIDDNNQLLKYHSS